MRKIILLILLLLFSLDFLSANNKIRRVTVFDDKIVTVNTALGIATIIQVPDSPNSIVVGDQELFKVEYLDSAVTIKPLASNTKTNIYIYTDWKRYNVELIAGSEQNADYVVYLDNPSQKSIADEIPWINFKNRLKNEEIILETSRVAKLKNGILQIEFFLSTSASTSETFSPDSIWLTQNGKTKPIHNLILSSLTIEAKVKTQGVMQVLASDLNLDEPFKIEVRRKKNSYLTIKAVNLWK